MAYFVESALLAGQALFTEKTLAKGEWRLPDVAALTIANKGLMANPSLADLRTREDRSVYAYLPIRQAAINGVARAHAHTGARGASQQEAITWSTFSEPFSISIKQADNNNFNWPAMYAATMRNAVLNIMARLDAWFVAAAVADKTAVNQGGGNGEFDPAPDIYVVPDVEKEYFFQNGKATLEFNGYKGELVAILDSKAGVRWDRLAAGAAGSVNSGFQMNGIMGVKTSRTVLGSGYEGSMLMFENGSVGVIPWIPKQNRQPIDPVKSLEYNGAYGQIPIGELGINFALHQYAARADGSQAGGYTQDLVLYGEVSVDIGYVSSPLSAFRGAGDSVVYAIGLTAH
jgi:hypothetical protein